ncbi:Predicted metalloprotease, contains C-terminal PDZ domain [Catalinimonas alkaloidigena]|uniref:Predicted metalloprotease, contains C-terminal PDZ domain n=1 Tax=Catalinimonas alkaloidigena TaxID=1075417 RepID=A0A1G9LRR1_9BACT|nr:PDZ domain-containing protein [Catalinimonas alkaloidigena]SDL64742.1 Predicted metalloprotease, contains C-terminal PDZ domain [Catalinimonas alkaloidigena]
MLFRLLTLCLLTSTAFAQTYTDYDIAFPNAAHHEAQVSVTMHALPPEVLELRMSRTSPGRYALHEFAKNVYAVKAVDGQGKDLEVTRPNPYQWNVAGHDGTVTVTYTLFANWGDGTYAQVDETHAHLNIPATFMFAPPLAQRPIRVTFHPRHDLNWKVATQLKPFNDTTYFAPNLDYFMDSPTEISDYDVREFTENGKTLRFVLHHNGTAAELDQYLTGVQKIVQQERAVFGELPDFDFGTYTFLACYLPNVDGDGMEHRNSTVLTDVEGLAEGGMEGNIGTVSHEFFHCWNVERIRPLSLQPFDYTEANMSGELWFAEGFTSYYTNLILCRAGLISPETYVKRLADGRGLNAVLTGVARDYFNPIEMSYQAPFVDAATAVDPNNRSNTFISYYTYGSVLGLALDLSLRERGNGLNLDDFMRLMWQRYGKPELPYTVRDLQATLADYAGNEFSDRFFGQYVFESQLPPYEQLLAGVGVVLRPAAPDRADLGVRVREGTGVWVLDGNPEKGGPAYQAGLEKDDVMLTFDGKKLKKWLTWDDLLKKYRPGQTVSIQYERYGQKKETTLTLRANPDYETVLFEQAGRPVTDALRQKRQAWLGAR